jgi:hypothetical protein
MREGGIRPPARSDDPFDLYRAVLDILASKGPGVANACRTLSKRAGHWMGKLQRTLESRFQAQKCALERMLSATTGGRYARDDRGKYPQPPRDEFGLDVLVTELLTNRRHENSGSS